MRDVVRLALHPVPQAIREAASAGWMRRWRSMLSVAVQRAVAKRETSDGALMDAVCRFTTPPPEPLDWSRGALTFFCFVTTPACLRPRRAR